MIFISIFIKHICGKTKERCYAMKIDFIPTIGFHKVTLRNFDISIVDYDLLKSKGYSIFNMNTQQKIKEIFLKVSDCVEHKASVIPIEVTGNICFFKY